MRHKIVIEVDGKLANGEVLIFEDGIVKSYEIHQLLPDLESAKETIALQSREIANLKQSLAELAKIVKEK